MPPVWSDLQSGYKTTTLTTQQNSRGFQLKKEAYAVVLAHNLTIYYKASIAEANWKKCKDFLMGKWQNQMPTPAFALDLRDMDISATSHFFKSVLQAWSSVSKSALQTHKKNQYTTTQCFKVTDCFPPNTSKSVSVELESQR